MSIKLGLFELNDPLLDRHPRSWICLSGANIREIISKIETEIILNRKMNREILSKRIGKTLGCNHVSIKNLFRGVNKFYPVPFIIELCKLTRKGKFYLSIIENETELLKVNSASSKPLRASKMLSLTWAKIVGAFCADGSLSMQFIISCKNKEDLERINFLDSRLIRKSLIRKEMYIALQINKSNYANIKHFSKENNKFQTQTHYVIELTDEHESSVLAFNRWIYDEFGIKPVSFYKKGNAWRTIFSNKIFARYLINFFGMLPGYKCDTIEEPFVIKHSSLNTRREFAKGVLMFDGSVSKKKAIHFSTLSSALARSIEEILVLDRINVSSFKNGRGEYVVCTRSGARISQLLRYFEEGTKKYDLLLWLDNKEFTSNQINLESDIENTKNILEILKIVKSCDSQFLMNKTGYSHYTIRQHLSVLKSRGIITLSCYPKMLNEHISEDTSVFLNQNFHGQLFKIILNKFGRYDEFAKFLGVHKSTLSAWRVGKNRVPLKLLREIGTILNISYQDVLNNVKETDREVAEIV